MGEQISSLREGMKKSPVKISIGEAGDEESASGTIYHKYLIHSNVYSYW